MGSSRTTALTRRRRKRATLSLPGPARGKRPGAKLSLPGPARGKRPGVRGSLPGPLRSVKRPSWKVVGLAGIAGVAATGVVVARQRRAHRELAPDELRERLHSRLAEVGADADPPSA